MNKKLQVLIWLIASNQILCQFNFSSFRPFRSSSPVRKPSSPVPQINSFKSTFKSQANALKKELKNERTRINQFIKSLSDKTLKKNLKVLVKEGWSSALIRLNQLMKDTKRSVNFNDFSFWAEEILFIEEIIQTNRNKYREMLMKKLN